MLTGTLPFTASDPMEWVHCHIAKQPLPPAERRKMFRAPYRQSLRSCSPSLRRNAIRPRPAWGAIFAAASLNGARAQCQRISAGEHEHPDRLLIPEKLYGRQRELEALLASFDRVVKSGIQELVLVSGYSGLASPPSSRAA